MEGLGIIGLSDAMPEKITQLSHYAPFVSAQAGQEVWIFYNNKVEYKYKAENEITSHFLLSYGFQNFIPGNLGRSASDRSRPGPTRTS